jgi:hypothetical protein
MAVLNNTIKTNISFYSHFYIRIPDNITIIESAIATDSVNLSFELLKIDFASCHSSIEAKSWRDCKRKTGGFKIPVL